jgi:chromosomal replication initiator protein
VSDTTIDLDDLWMRALEALQQDLRGPASRAWLEQTVPVGYSDDTVVLAAPHNFAREQLDIRHGEALRNALTRAAGRALQVVVTVAPENPGTRETLELPDRQEIAPERLPTPATDAETALNPKYTFERFVIGDSNRFAHAAAFAVAEAPAKAYNPLFVYGGAGLGKTHLLQAVGFYARRLYRSCACAT